MKKIANTKKSPKKRHPMKTSREVRAILKAGVPNTKRLRKKKEWRQCRDCRKWFNRWQMGSNIHFEDGSITCHSCSKSYFERALKEKNKKNS